MQTVEIARLRPPLEKYQDTNLFLQYLPYCDKLDAEADEWLKEIKENLGRAIMISEMRPGVVIWITRLTSYINLHGYKFSKQEHIEFIRATWSLLTNPGTETRLLDVFARSLSVLLSRKDLLSPADLQLEWKPLYLLLEDLSSHNVLMNLKVYPPDFEKNLKTLIKLSRSYFPASATSEILSKFRPFFCPHDNMMTRGISYCSLFLPTLHLEVQNGEIKRIEPAPFLPWLNEFQEFWFACSNAPPWEGSMINLFSRLATDNIGLIDWGKITPDLFNKMMLSFGLPVYYKRLGVPMKPISISKTTAARWIVFSISKDSEILKYLSVLMNAVNSYYHPTSAGSYSDNLVEFLNKLIFFFMTRIRLERFESVHPIDWIPEISPENKITDLQIQEFCEIVLPATLNLACSRKYVEVERNNLNILASIRPDLVIPPLLRKLDLSLETLTEPFKFTAAVKCLVSVARNLVKKDPLLPQGQDQVLRVLFSVLPGIDCNDIKKTLTVFQLISIIARLVPFTNLSSKKIKNQPVYSFKTFIIEFLDRCFSLIENSSLELIRQEQSNGDTQMSNEESSINTGIVTCFDSILHQADEDLKVLAMQKLKDFLHGRILEPKVAGKIASGMCRTCAKISPVEILAAFVPTTCSILRDTLRETDLSTDFYLGDEIMFNLLLLSDLVIVPGYFIIPYISQISEVLKLGLQSKNREGHTAALTVFRHTLHSLSHPCLAERGRIVSTPSQNPREDWGRQGNLENLDVKWYLPGEKEFHQISELGTAFLGTQVDRLTEFIEDKNQMDREEVYQSLKTISSFIIGCSPFLPHWTEPAIYTNPSKVQQKPRRHITTIPSQDFSFQLRGVENTRIQLVELMENLVAKILKDRADDTKVLISIATILKLLIFEHTCTDEGLEKHMKNFQQSKSRLELRILGRNKDIRAILLDRVLIQHEKRLVENILNSLTGTHVRIMNLLLDLSMSHYSKVRTHGQNILAKVCKWFSYSYKIIVPRVLSKLLPDPDISHEEFKGALYLVLQNQLLVKHNWELQVELWPLLVRAQHNEKPSITALIKSITGYIHSIDNWTITCAKSTEETKGYAGRLVSVPPSLSEIQDTEDESARKSVSNLKQYHLLTENLCGLVESSDLHWRHYNTALSMLCSLLRHDVDFPLRAVKIFTNNIIHDDVVVRKASIHVLDCILQKTKRKHPKVSVSLSKVETVPPSLNCDQGSCLKEDTKIVFNVTNGCEIIKEVGIETKGCENEVKNSVKTMNQIESNPISGILIPDLREKLPVTDSNCSLLVRPGERQDNIFLQYGDENKPNSQEEYDAPRFIHKTYLGFYVWPKENLAYAPSSQQPNLDRTLEEMPDSEKIVFSLFSDKEKVKKLFTFLTLEHKKGRDSFDVERFGMFKAIFRNFGDLFLENFRTEIETLVGDHRESFQRAAAELLASIIRGSKHWPYQKIENMWFWILPAIRTALNHVSPETQRDWGTCFATSSENRDPNRLHWLMEVAMEDPIRSQGSFIDASRLYMLQGVVSQQRWRVGKLLHRLLEFLIPFLDHPFHNVRSRLGAVLTNVFALDLEFGEFGNASVSSPIEKDFVFQILSRLQVLQDTEEKDENALRLLQTVSKWICCSLVQNIGPLKIHTLEFLPILLQYEWYDRDPQLARDCQVSLSFLSRSLLPVRLLNPLCSILQQTINSDSWRTKLSTLDFLQAVIFNNFIQIWNKGPETKNTVLDIVGSGLLDDQLEVRVKSSQVLSGLIHCKFIPELEYKTLINRYKQSVAGAGTVSSRHGAVLGLCAFISAFPHDVPFFLPDLLIYIGNLLSERQPISATIKKTVQNFKRTHQDNWSEHKENFSEDQLSELTNLLISPSYYA